MPVCEIAWIKYPIQVFPKDHYWFVFVLQFWLCLQPHFLLSHPFTVQPYFDFPTHLYPLPFGPIPLIWDISHHPAIYRKHPRYFTGTYEKYFKETKLVKTLRQWLSDCCVWQLPRDGLLRRSGHGRSDPGGEWRQSAVLRRPLHGHHHVLRHVQHAARVQPQGARHVQSSARRVHGPFPALHQAAVTAPLQNLGIQLYTVLHFDCLPWFSFFLISTSYLLSI